MARRKVLVVDDEKCVVELSKDILESAGYKVVPAYNGKEALEKVYTESPDLILLDILLPKVDGYQVCRDIRKDLLLANIPIVLLIDRGKERDEIKGLGIAADDYIVKPFRPGVLLARVKMVLKRRLRSLEANLSRASPGILQSSMRSRNISTATDFSQCFILASTILSLLTTGIASSWGIK
ncbi:MAG: response regulator [bacterium]